LGMHRQQCHLHVKRLFVCAKARLKRARHFTRVAINGPRRRHTRAGLNQPATHGAYDPRLERPTPAAQYRGQPTVGGWKQSPDGLKDPFGVPGMGRLGVFLLGRKPGLRTDDRSRPGPTLRTHGRAGETCPVISATSAGSDSPSSHPLPAQPEAANRPEERDGPP
jgi:hypothetical protein